MNYVRWDMDFCNLVEELKTDTNVERRKRDGTDVLFNSDRLFYLASTIDGLLSRISFVHPGEIILREEQRSIERGS